MTTLAILTLATIAAPRRMLMLAAALFALSFLTLWRLVRWIGDT